MNNYLITPDSDIYLLKCPLEIDSMHQLDFTNATTQHNYFNGLTKMLMDDATYMRQNGRLYFDGSFDTCLTYNYCMYKNNGYSNKWFYAFVTDLRFESNNSCSCQLVTDVYQTWQFDITLKYSFIERYIPSKSSDTIGAFTYPEQLELGDYISNDAQEVSELKSQKMVIGSTADYTDLSKASNGIYQNIPTGCGYYCANLDPQGDGVSAMRGFLQDLTDSTRQDAVTSLFLAPEFLCSSNQTGDIRKINDSYNPATLTYTLSTAVTGLNGYTPKNNKLYTYPYYFIQVTNGAGGNAILKPELWDDFSTKRYRMYCALTPGCSIIGVPMDYSGYAIAWEEALPLGKYPQLNYSTDQFTNWQTQNGLNNTIQQIGGIATSVSGAGTLATSMTSMMAGGFGDGAGRDLSMGMHQYVGGMLQTLDAMQEKYLASLVPAQFRGNANSGDVWSSASEITFRFNWMSIKYEYARAIDLFFSMYGYRVNRLGAVLTKTRSNWNYIKTIDVNITGDIPQDDMQRIKALYNNGFTIWHDPATFLDYSQNNT